MAKGVKVEIRVGELSEESVVSDQFYKKLVDLVATQPWALSRLFEIGVTAADAGEALRKGSKLGGMTAADAIKGFAGLVEAAKRAEPGAKRKRAKKDAAR